MHKDKKTVIGIISVEGDETHVTEEEFRLALSDHVEIVMAYAPLEKVSYNGLMAFLDKLPGAVDEFADHDPDIIIVASMTGSAVRGYEIVNMLEQRSGRPVIVPALEMKKFLKTFNLRRIAVVSAFGVELNLLEQLFFCNHDIEVINLINIYDERTSEDRMKISQIDCELILRKVKEADFGSVEAVVFDSPTYNLRPIIGELMELIKVPILSVNQILLYSVLKRLHLPTEQAADLSVFQMKGGKRSV